MSLLFYVDDKNCVLLRPDCVKLCPELGVLNEKEVMLIIYTYDYHGPYRQFPEADRKRKAMTHVYGENVPEKFDEPTIKIAIEAYKSLQYIPEIDQEAIYRAKIEKLNAQLEIDDSPTSIKKTIDAIHTCEEAIRDLQKRATDAIVAKGQIKGGQELSFIEEIMKNRKYYLSVTAKR